MRTKVAIYLPDKIGRVLLGRRVTHENNTDHEWWDIIGGEIKDGETNKDATIRDVKEDTDMDVRHAVELFEETEDTKSGEWKAVVMMADKYDGEPRIVIKEKFCEFRWFAFDRLPEHLYPVTRRVLERLAKMLEEKTKEARAKAEQEAEERKKELEKAKHERQKLLDAPIDCYRVILRRWEKKDSKDFDEYVQRDLATHSKHCVNKKTQDDNPKLDEYIKDETKWAVELKETGKVIGGFSLDYIDNKDKNHEREIVHTLDEKHVTGGYTTEATKGLVNYGFEVLGLSTIHASLCETNLGGLKVLNSCGFKLDKILNNKQVCKFDGKLHSTKDFTITAGEWKEFKTKHPI